jgi:formamidopyrimidine-DNA glycosylase
LGLFGGWCYLKKDKKINLKNIDFSKNMDYYAEHISYDKIKSYLTNALNHLNVEFKTDKGSLYYYDTLSFGTLKVIKTIEELHEKLEKIGPDIMDSNTTFEVFKEKINKIKNLKKEIGIVLMDQKIISGIGNYLRADILYLSKINPFRKVKNLTNLELKKIFNNSKLLTWGEYDIDEAKQLNIIKSNSKLPVDYNRLFFVYQEDTDIHGYTILKKELYEGNKKRFIFFVPQIQK